MSENYFQHADHFKRILNDQENIKKIKNAAVEEESNKEKATQDNKESIIEKSLA